MAYRPIIQVDTYENDAEKTKYLSHDKLASNHFYS